MKRAGSFAPLPQLCTRKNVTKRSVETIEIDKLTAHTEPKTATGEECFRWNIYHQNLCETGSEQKFERAEMAVATATDSVRPIALRGSGCP